MYVILMKIKWKKFVIIACYYMHTCIIMCECVEKQENIGQGSGTKAYLMSIPVPMWMCVVDYYMYFDVRSEKTQ